MVSQNQPMVQLRIFIFPTHYQQIDPISYINDNDFDEMGLGDHQPTLITMTMILMTMIKWALLMMVVVKQYDQGDGDGGNSNMMMVMVRLMVMVV